MYEQAKVNVYSPQQWKQEVQPEITVNVDNAITKQARLVPLSLHMFQKIEVVK